MMSCDFEIAVVDRKLLDSFAAEDVQNCFMDIYEQYLWKKAIKVFESGHDVLSELFQEKSSDRIIGLEQSDFEELRTKIKNQLATITLADCETNNVDLLSVGEFIRCYRALQAVTVDWDKQFVVVYCSW